MLTLLNSTNPSAIAVSRSFVDRRPFEHGAEKSSTRLKEQPISGGTLMTQLPRLAAFALLSLTLLPAHAQILPGLWEFSSGDIQVDGQQMPGMDAMLAQMENLPADQRRMMEEMLAAQGVKLGGKGVQICLSKAQVESDELPFQDDPACTQEITERGDKLWKFRFECPDARGQGETRFISDKELVSTVESQYRQGTETGTSRIESHARWIADDCGALKPAR